MKYMNKEYTTIRVSRELKKRLDNVKVHPREPYQDVIKRLLEKCK